MSSSISVKLRFGVGVNFKPLLKVWTCEGVQLTVNKFRTLRWIISSSFGWISLHLGHKGKKLSPTELPTFSSAWFGTSCASGKIMVCSFCWLLLLTFRHSFWFPLFQIFLLVFFCMVLFYKKKSLFSPFLFWSFSWCRPLMGLFVESLNELCWLFFYFDNGYHCFFSFSGDCASFYLSDHFRSFC